MRITVIRKKKNWVLFKKSWQPIKSEKKSQSVLIWRSADKKTEYETRTFHSKFFIHDLDDKWIYITIPNNEITHKNKLSRNLLSKLVKDSPVLNKVIDVQHFFNRKNHSQWDSYYFALYHEIKDKITNDRQFQFQIEKKPEKKNYVLIIDEINRGNISKIFGELITLIEKDKRLGELSPISVYLPYSNEEFALPPNLFIIGTMNTTDRSTGVIDYAIRRRFAFYTLQSDKSLISDEGALELYDCVENFLKENKIDTDMDDLMVGHSYFFVENSEDLESNWEYEIFPLLIEYYKDGIIKSEPQKNINDFINANKPKVIQDDNPVSDDLNDSNLEPSNNE